MPGGAPTGPAVRGGALTGAAMPGGAPQALPAGIPSERAVLARAGGENFPVALRLLSARHRAQLTAIYGFARLVDQLGDDYAGDRLAALDWLQEELDRAYRAQARHPLMVRVQDALDAGPLPREPFARLIEANRTDQRVRRYATFEQLLSYCHLSADPVGELVLCAFGLATPERIALSNHVCTALQLAEHWQDVAEDLGRGRVYIPAEDIERFAVAPERLSAPDLATRGRMRRLMAFEVARARELLERGAPLVREVPGRPKLAVAAFVAGGRTALGAIERRGFDVLDGPPRAGRARRLAAAARLLAEGRR
jgi:squalene synthase HpnC